MTYESHKETRKGFTIRIVQDDDPLNPFTDQDGLPDIIGFHNRYNFNTRKEDSSATPESFLQEAKEKGYFIRPLFMMDHSGLSFSLSDFGDKWDSGQLGFMFWTPESRESLGITDSYIDSILQENETRDSWLSAQMDSAVEALNDLHGGNVWGFIVEDDKGQEVESVWGFFGDYDRDGGALNEARSIVDYQAKEETPKAREAISAAQNEALTLAAELELMGSSLVTARRVVCERIHELAQEETRQKARLAALETESD